MSDDTYYRQHRLRSGSAVMTCWLEAGRLRQGQAVTLKGDERRWEVEMVYRTRVRGRDLHTDWNVGGLEGSQ